MVLPVNSGTRRAPDRRPDEVTAAARAAPAPTRSNPSPDLPLAALHLSRGAAPIRPRSAGMTASSIGHRAGTAAALSPVQSEAIARLQDLHRRFTDLVNDNWGTEELDKVFDQAMLPTLVAAESARHPSLPLSLLESPAAVRAWFAAPRPDGERARAVLTLPTPGEDHVVAADLQRHADAVSIVIADPLRFNQENQARYTSEVLPALARLLPEGGTAALFMLDIQTSDSGCRIFALSAASKFAQAGERLNALHRQALESPGQPPRTALGRTAQPLAQDGAVQVLEGRHFLPAEFFKHAQRQSSLDGWKQAQAPGQADAAVNRRGESLPDRHHAHRQERYKMPFLLQAAMAPDSDDDEAEPVSPRTMSDMLEVSDSIERKRIAFIGRAIAYLHTASPAESQALLDRMVAHDVGEPDDIAALDLGQRLWGPDPRTLPPE
ncbi:YopJ family acetyltransferase [Acidovorax sp. SUPP2539]|uniref:YopJ family acetyltransferase n=1 Tax=Acidovorax sp. SUPP2539 TaxID=2920878 RepID=UPI0023DE3AB4|nr:YopJ family acetyltransferase [Acidovorax sp. SUPP2539]GKS87703.1 hypothetical protein AVTE2539_00080 [Acidovorax sp. SUPP2539]